MKDRFKELRKALSLTQQQFSDQLDLSRNYIAQIEMGAKSPSNRTIKDICRTFNVNYDWLAYGTGSMFQIEDTNSVELIGKRIYALRKTLGLTQTEFANALSMGQQALSMIESGKRDLTEKNIKLICFSYNVSRDWLVHGSGEMFQDDNDIIPDTISSISDADEEFMKTTLVKLIKLDPKYWHMIREIFEELQKL